MTHSISGELECWPAQQSPFQILYSRLVLEQIRLAVVDAYFLVPHGGVEIGGVLLGKYHDRQVEVINHEPMECEHAFGPWFSLSPRDEERLNDILSEVRDKSGGLEPVGWYHSHTRSEIFLTEADLEIHNRYFPEMWQVALVVRPSTSQPARAGFFFRELGGLIHASASYHEFKLEPLRGQLALREKEEDAQDLLNNGDSEAPNPAALPTLESKPQPVIGSNPHAPLESPAASTADPPSKLERQVAPIADSAPLANSPPAKEPSPKTAVAPIPVRRVDSESQVIELPRFLRSEPPPQTAWSRVPLFIVAMLCSAIALGAFAFVKGDAVLPSIRNFARRVSTTWAASPPARIGPAMSINAIDDLGQVQIRWDTSSPAVQAARSAVLSIVDGGPPQPVPLDGPHLQAGAFTYKRHGARVDVRLTVMTARGSSVEAATTFLGPPPVAEAESVPAHAGAAALAKQNAQLRRQLDEQIARNKTLQAQLDRLRKQRPPKKRSPTR